MTSEGSTTTIQTLLDQGNKAFEKGDYETSTVKLGEACQQLDSLNGELNLKNGDAYFLYGRALLQYAIQRNSVLGNSAQASAEEVEHQQVETNTSAENTNPRFQFDEQPVFESSETGDESSKNDSNKAGDASDDDNDDDDNEEVQEDDFETAWDVLDVARLIYEKSEDEDGKMKLADVLLCLGDVSLETEKFDEALPDFEKAIEIKRSILKDDNRQLAEAHYKYALALELSTKAPQLALSELQKAQRVLKNRKATLENGSTQDDTGDKGKMKHTPDENSQKEIVEIQELVSDLDEKITELSDRQDSEREAQELLKNLFGGLSKPAGETKPQDLTASSQVNDLSSLIKRKAKEIVDNSNSDSTSDLKKPKNE
ncbi:hypothetical protein BCR42DRAFT_340312 [Absidia repens]|uniref:Tetratricopeptide SHNi-TPR domain-containing protein n=1 Tax=Absidia repens TaxID=90262 RepID=A0A1X2J0G2_9FUNG|nr:hypothetical protein BCR42DRAFT_340312 [Absidia repens]